MKKLLCAILTIAMTAALLSGCSLFSSGDGDDSNSGSSTDPVKMTDSYTFTDPSDIEFEKRYVVRIDETSGLIQQLYSEELKGIYGVFYADANDGPVVGYEFMICTSPESVQEITNRFASGGLTLIATEEDPLVLYYITDADGLEANMVSYVASGLASEAVVSAYAEAYASTQEGTLLN